MATIGLSTILAVLGDSWQKRNNKELWSGWLSGGKTGKVTVEEVSFEENELFIKIKLKDGGVVSLKAVPDTLNSTNVTVEGDGDEGYSLVFALKPSLGDLTRFAFDFRRPKAPATAVRYNLRFDP